MKLLPIPKNFESTGGTVTLKSTLSFDERFSAAAETFRDFAERIHGVRFEKNDRGDVRFSFIDGLLEEEYRVDLSKEGCLVFASSCAGAQNAAVTLVQLMESESGGVAFPSVSISDRPDSAWRGVMIDLARVFHDIRFLYEYVDMCRFYKLKYLHLHFNDDQSYTLPSSSFPLLSTPERHYSEEELAGLLRYAKKRGVQIVPELDIPGHCTAFQKAYGDVFGKNGIISMKEDSLAGVETVLKELCALFKDSPYIHIGGDEAAISFWTEDEDSLSTVRSHPQIKGLNKQALAEYMYAYFVARMCKCVLNEGKTPVVWEGFPAAYNDMIPREALIMSWENYYQTTPELLAAGFDVVNCSWRPMYVVTPKRYWTVKEIYEWSVYTWQGTHPDSPYLETPYHAEPSAQVKGGQLLAWGDWIVSAYPDHAEGVRAEQRLVEERAPALAENVWNHQKRGDWADFSERISKTGLLYARLRGDKV